jgi:hypothetical protein
MLTASYSPNLDNPLTTWGYPQATPPPAEKG